MNNVKFYDKQVKFQEEMRKIQEQRIALESDFYNLSKTDKKLQSIRTNKLRSYWKQVSDREKRARQRNEALLRDFSDFERRVDKLQAETTKLEQLKNKCEDELTQMFPEWRYGIDISRAKNQLDSTEVKKYTKVDLSLPDRVLTSSPPPSMIPHIDMPLFKLVPFNFSQNTMSLHVDSPNVSFSTSPPSMRPYQSSALPQSNKPSSSVAETTPLQQTTKTDSHRNIAPPENQSNVVVPPLQLPEVDETVGSHSSPYKNLSGLNRKEASHAAEASQLTQGSVESRPNFGSFNIVPNNKNSTYLPSKNNFAEETNPLKTASKQDRYETPPDSIHDKNENGSIASLSFASKSTKPSLHRDSTSGHQVFSANPSQRSSIVSEVPADIPPTKTSSPIKIPRPSIDSAPSEAGTGEISHRDDEEDRRYDAEDHRDNAEEHRDDLEEHRAAVMHSSDESDLSEDKKSGLSDDKEPANDVPLTENPTYLKMRQFGESPASLESSANSDDQNDDDLENLVSPKPKLPAVLSDDEFSEDERKPSVSSDEKAIEDTSASPLPVINKPSYVSRFSSKKQRAPWDTESEDDDSYRIPRGEGKVSTDDDDFDFFD